MTYIFLLTIMPVEDQKTTVRYRGRKLRKDINEHAKRLSAGSIKTISRKSSSLVFSLLLFFLMILSA